MAKVVVTGAAGFIGACLSHYFADQKNYAVIEVDDFS
ncbi:MAG: NAD-dependent epimerase/dehydratase family protein, partial [Flavobacteriia bacterium]|nr:NAD-dependent epimerase/dehydratase family protein [Flavobacteriia bacterium]